MASPISSNYPRLLKIKPQPSPHWTTGQPPGPMCVAFLSLDAELFSRLFTNVWLEKRMENHGGGDKLQCVPLMANLWPQLRDPFPFPKPKATPKPKRNQLRVIVGLQLKLGLGQHGDLLINLTNSALIFADFVRHTRMHLICLKRA